MYDDIFLGVPLEKEDFMKLPEFFEENFKILMDADEYRDFIASFDGKRNYGIRVNTLK